VRLKVDENLPVEVASLLRGVGHDAVTVREEGLAGTDDPALERICQGETRALLTADVGFGNIVAYPPMLSAGIIVLRLSRQDKPFVVSRVESLLPRLDTEPVAGRLWIVDDRRVRIRG